MSRRANPAVLGLFVVVAVAAAVAAALVLGSGRLFRERTRVVFYFKGSVAGLDAGAPVEFSGVRLGTVTDVRMVYDSATRSVRIPVYAELEGDRISGLEDAAAERPGDHLRQGIEQGMKGRLEMQSFLTGKLKVVLVQDPGAESAEVREEGGAMVVPTVAGPWAELADKIEDLPFQQIVYSLDASLKRVSDLLASPELHASLSNLNDTVASVSQIAGDIHDARVDELGKELRELIAQVRADAPWAALGGAGTNLSATLVRSQAMMSDLASNTVPVREEAVVALREISEAARALQQLADYLERHPEALLRGKKGGD